MFDRISRFVQSIAKDLGKPTHQENNEREELLDLLDLRDWYNDLSEEERWKVRQSGEAHGPGGSVNLMEHKFLSTDMTQQDFLHSVGSSAVNDGDYEFAEKVLHQALDAKGGSPKRRHFIYNSLIEMYYKQRDERDDAIEKCIKYCKKDNNEVDAFLHEWKKDSRTLPRIPSFKRLAIIYEKQERYEKAIEVCDEALERGLDDNTKGGFEGRKQRIQKKLDE